MVIKSKLNCVWLCGIRAEKLKKGKRKKKKEKRKKKKKLKIEPQAQNKRNFEHQRRFEDQCWWIITSSAHSRISISSLRNRNKNQMKINEKVNI